MNILRRNRASRAGVRLFTYLSKETGYAIYIEEIQNGRKAEDMS